MAGAKGQPTDAWSTQVESLLQQLATRARTDIDAVLISAREEAERLRKDASQRCEERRTKALASCNDEATHARYAAIAGARREARANVLEAQHALADRVVRAARDLIVGRLRIAGDTPALRDRVAELLTYFDQPSTVAVVTNDDGVLLTDSAHGLEIRDSVDVWLARERPRIAIDVCRAVEANT
jgi:vacuolar-type H+-ATPase subunit E/Vma4